MEMASSRRRKGSGPSSKKTTGRKGGDGGARRKRQGEMRALAKLVGFQGDSAEWLEAPGNGGGAERRLRRLLCSWLVSFRVHLEGILWPGLAKSGLN